MRTLYRCQVHIHLYKLGAQRQSVHSLTIVNKGHFRHMHKSHIQTCVLPWLEVDTPFFTYI